MAAGSAVKPFASPPARIVDQITHIGSMLAGLLWKRRAHSGVAHISL